MIKEEIAKTSKEEHPSLSNQDIGVGFVTRDKTAKSEEDKGIIEFQIHTNDGCY